jgi:hypothetical protein
MYVKEINDQMDKVLRPLFANKYFIAFLFAFVGLYSGFLAPKLPNSVIYFFDTTFGKLLFIFLIAFVASRNVPNSFTVALVVSVAFLLTLTVLQKTKVREAFRITMEHFENEEEDADKKEDDADEKEDDAVEYFEAEKADAKAKEVEKKMTCEQISDRCAKVNKGEMQTKLCNSSLILDTSVKPLDAPNLNDLDTVFTENNCKGYLRKCMNDNKSYVKTVEMVDIKPSDKETCI